MPVREDSHVSGECTGPEVADAVVYHHATGRAFYLETRRPD